jgi:hypothetical protein
LVKAAVIVGLGGSQGFDAQFVPAPDMLPCMGFGLGFITANDRINDRLMLVYRLQDASRSGERGTTEQSD